MNALNVIHIAGTKGKGSTCAFIASLLQAHGKRTGFPRTVGLYTSPHLIRPEERIQINSRPLTENVFAQHILGTWNDLSSLFPEKDMPRYLQLLALTSFRAFIEAGVDTAVYETHSGGEYDVTNIVKKPIATGITTLGMDHAHLLGPSLKDIAWHKAGIFKTDTPAFSVPQEAAAAAVLKRRADDKGVPLRFVHDEKGLNEGARVLKPPVLRVNCSLAIAIANAFLDSSAREERHGNLTTNDIQQGLEHYCWPGRFQRIIRGNKQWFLDGAHNELSIQKAAQWFAETAPETQYPTRPLTRAIIFSHSSDRDGKALMKCLLQSLRVHNMKIDHVIFSTYKTWPDSIARQGMLLSLYTVNDL